MSTVIPFGPVQRDGEDLFTTSEAIASGAGVQHKNTLELIDRHADDLADFGRVAFETRPFQTPGGVQQKRVARLNEQQATLLLTYLRNTEQVRAFKKALVKAFYAMAETIRAEMHRPRSLEERMQEVMRELDAKVSEQQAALEAAAPKVAAWESVVSSAGSWSYNDAAKVLCEEGQIEIGEKRLVNCLVDWGYLYRDTKGRPHVYQRHLERGLFVVKARTYRDNVTGEVRESSAPQVRITGKGLDMLRTRLAPTGTAIQGELMEVTG